MSENPNTTTLQTGLGRPSRRTGNRIDRLTERQWWLRQQITFPLGATAIAISIARTYYTRAIILGVLYVMADYQIIVPGALMMAIGAYLAWELILGAYLWSSSAPKFDLMVRVFIAVVSTALVYGHLYEGLCRA